MTARKDIGTFLLYVLGVAAIGGGAAGFTLGTGEAVRAWRAGGFDLHDTLYLALIAGGLLIAAAGFLARGSAAKPPFVPMIAGFAVLGVAFNGLTRDFTGQIAQFLGWACGCSFGAALGLFLATAMMRRAERGQDR